MVGALYLIDPIYSFSDISTFRNIVLSSQLLFKINLVFIIITTIFAGIIDRSNYIFTNWIKNSVGEQFFNVILFIVLTNQFAYSLLTWLLHLLQINGYFVI